MLVLALVLAVDQARQRPWVKHEYRRHLQRPIIMALEWVKLYPLDLLVVCTSSRSLFKSCPDPTTR